MPALRSQVFSSVASPNANANLPLGMRNNNPGNIKFSPNNNWGGQLGASEGTDQGDQQVVFDTPQNGMAAAYQLALKKYMQGAHTLNELIAGKKGWTPGNRQAAMNIAASMGIGADDDINMHDPAMAARFLRGLVTQEHGSASSAYSDQMIHDAVAGVRQPAPATGGQYDAGKSPLDYASKEIGIKSAAIGDYLRTGGQNLDPVTAAWCASFVNASLEHAGLPTTHSDLARSFLTYGSPVEAANLQPGDIAVFARGDPKGPFGHVGFVQSYDPKTGQIQLLAGNQGGQVSVQPYLASKALGFRHPGTASGAPAVGPDIASLESPKPQQAYTAAKAAPSGGGGLPATATTPATQPAQPPSIWSTIADAGSAFGKGMTSNPYTAPPIPPTPGAARIDEAAVPTVDPQQQQVNQQRMQMALSVLGQGQQQQAQQAALSQQRAQASQQALAQTFAQLQQPSLSQLFAQLQQGGRLA